MSFTIQERETLIQLGYKEISPEFMTLKVSDSSTYITKMSDDSVSTSTHAKVIFGPGRDQWMVVHVFNTYASFNDWLEGKLYPVKQKIWWDQNDEKF